MTWSIEAVETAYDGWSKILRATVRTPDGQSIRREVEHHGIAVAVLPYDPDRRVATLVRQFRPPAFQAAGQESVLEAPAGLMEEDDPEACAFRELFEEAGLRPSRLEPLGVSWSMPGVSTERVHLFLAAYGPADRAGLGGGLAEEHEDIAVDEIGLADLARMADRGELDDMKTFALVQTLRIRRPDLFTA
jgi:nudix-type nucleoside diphosphatase (YffH/AdpP family)